MSDYKVISLADQLNYYLSLKDNNALFNEEEIFLDVKKCFPSLSDDECKKMIDLISELDKKRNKEKVDLAITAPHSFSFKANPTSIVMENLLKNAAKIIVLTGYSISDYFDDLLDIIIDKVNRGILVRLYINDYENKKEKIEKLLLYKGRFLEIYNYNKQADSIDALHAKIITVDNYKTLITSANLSFNGLQKNIEVGSIIESERISKNIQEMFYQLFKKKVFNRI